MKPQLLNREHVSRELTRRYPPAFRDRGVGASASLRGFVDEKGRVTFLQIQESSGTCEFDVAALAVGRVMRFAPAVNKGKPVGVYIQLPVTFKTR